MVNAGQDAVQLMTVHSSKGLEFDGVFLSGLEEGLFPHENSQNDPKSLEEERRLMYVAITRARRRLYISYSQSRMLHGQTRFNYRSRFLEELPSKALKLLTPPVQKMQWHNTQHTQNTPFSHSNSTAFKAVLTSSESSSSLRVGMRVAHAKFGNGTVLTLEGKGNEARAQINFPMHGVKWMALSVAKLTPVE
jgi:DNA helicase-2/ATP-dependent DNA helicase PcrA